ncbi:MAG: Hpt domain-containing protein [Treponema sp.]|nr:Hpt domain-containing protein [Treponema sp.]
MNSKNFYDSIGGSYEDVIQRLGSDSLIERFVKMFPSDESYANLCKAMDEKNWSEVFGASHTLKGICANLSFKNLYEAASTLTEDVRNGSPSEKVHDYFDKVCAEYKIVMDSLKSEGVA